MKIKSYTQSLFWGLTGVQIVLMSHALSVGAVESQNYLIRVGLILMCISLGLLMSYERLTLHISVLSIFIKPKAADGQPMVLSIFGVFAVILGKFGFALWLIGFILYFK